MYDAIETECAKQCTHQDGITREKIFNPNNAGTYRETG